MVEDVADAITSYRPYRKAKSLETAIKELRDEKEKYSEELIDLFGNIL